MLWIVRIPKPIRQGKKKLVGPFANKRAAIDWIDTVKTVEPMTTRRDEYKLERLYRP